MRANYQEMRANNEELREYIKKIGKKVNWRNKSRISECL